jgi:hypothetical protein
MRVGQSCPHRCAIGWYIWQRPSLSAAYDAAGNGAWGAMSQFRNISLTGRDRRRYSGCGTQKKDWGTNFRVRCEAFSQMQNRVGVGRGNRRPEACRARWPLLAMLHWAGESRCCGGEKRHGEQAAGTCCVFPISADNMPRPPSSRCAEHYPTLAAEVACRAPAGQRTFRFITSGASAPTMAQPAPNAMHARGICEPAPVGDLRASRRRRRRHGRSYEGLRNGFVSRSRAARR